MKIQKDFIDKVQLSLNFVEFRVSWYKYIIDSVLIEINWFIEIVVN